MVVTLAAQDPAETPAGSVKAMLVVEDGAQVTLYVASPEKGLYTKTWHGAPPTTIKYEELQRADLSGPFNRPTALAQTKDHLFVLDTNRVVQWALHSQPAGIAQQVMPVAQLSSPTSMAVSPEGAVYVGDAGARSIQRITSGAETRTVATELNPTSLSFVGRELQAFDRDASTVYFLPQTNNPGPPDVLRQLPTFETSAMHDVLASVGSAINHRGVYYLASPDGVLVQGAGRPSPLPLTTAAADALAVTDDHVYIAEHDGIRILPRAVPATFSFEGSREVSTEIAVRVYEYLAAHGLLYGTAYVNDHAYAALDEFLAAHRILPSPLPSGRPGAGAAAVTASLRRRLDLVLCKIALANCGRIMARSAVPEGSTVIAPHATLTTGIRLSPVNLQGRSVRDHLDERVADARDRDEITAEYLISANQASSLDLALTRMQFTIAAPAREQLPPGMVIYLSGEREYVKNDLHSYCQVDVTPTMGQQFALPPHLTSREVSAYLPRTETFNRPPALPGVDRVEFEFGDAIIEQLPTGVVRQALAKPSVRDCLRAFVPSDTVRLGPDVLTNALVVSALRVKGARYRFLDADGKPAPLTANDFLQRGILGRFDAKLQVLEYDRPFYVAYRSVPWSSVLADGLEEQPVSPADLRSSQDIFKMTRGRLLLPATVWRLEALVPARDAVTDKSALQALRRGFPTLRIAPAGSGGSLPQSTGHQTVDGAAPSIDDATADRTNLFDVIDYKKTLLAEIADAPSIAVAERSRSVNFFHPDFMDTPNASAWQRSVSKFSFAPWAPPFPVGSSGGTIGTYAEDDHGTHVAGILASRATAPAPGLLPTARLFLLDTTDLSKFPEYLDDVVAKLVFTVNLSNKMVGTNIKCVGTCLQDAKDAIAGTKDTVLYVMAAGNDSQGLDDPTGTFPPLGWLETFKENMIGVAATTADGQTLLTTTTDTHKHTIQGSNWGPRFVQLAAPGASVYGPLYSAGTYGDASGTSQAVPQVTAAVELLRRSKWAGPLHPEEAKARLIYTSKWVPKFDGAVWGGLLDVKRALLRPDSNLISNFTEPERLFRIFWDGDPEISIAPVPFARVYRPNLTKGAPQRGPETIRLSRVLRLEYVENKYRVVYLEKDNGLTILHNVQLKGDLTCRRLQEWDDTVQDFVPSDYYPGCRIPLQQIRDYTAKIPHPVSFR